MTIYTDSATVRVAVTPSSVDGATYIDAATVYFDITASAVEFIAKPDFTGEGVAHAQYTVIPTDETLLMYESDANPQYGAKLRFGGLNA